MISLYDMPLYGKYTLHCYTCDRDRYYQSSISIWNVCPIKLWYDFTHKTCSNYTWLPHGFQNLNDYKAILLRRNLNLVLLIWLLRKWVPWKVDIFFWSVKSLTCHLDYWRELPPTWISHCLDWSHLCILIRPQSLRPR
jgi:hypothetical protein